MKYYKNNWYKNYMRNYRRLYLIVNKYRYLLTSLAELENLIELNEQIRLRVIIERKTNINFWSSFDCYNEQLKTAAIQRKILFKKLMILENKIDFIFG